MWATARELPRGIEPISSDEARRLIRQDSGPELEALLDRANAVRTAVHGDQISLCGIINAKSGRCPEDCAFCSQSAHFREAEAPVYDLVSPREIASASASGDSSCPTRSSLS